MKIKSCPYKITKTLKNAIKWLNANKRKIEKSYCKEKHFDYPDYWGMPKKFSYRLFLEHVDWIQEETYDWNFELSIDDYHNKIRNK